jgi:hypothetical protein
MAPRLVNGGVLEIDETNICGFSERNARALCGGYLRVTRKAGVFYDGTRCLLDFVFPTCTLQNPAPFILWWLNPPSEVPFRPCPALPHLRTLSVSYTSGIPLVPPFLCIQENHQLSSSITHLDFTPLHSGDETAGGQLLLKLKDVFRTLVLSISTTPRGEKCRGSDVPFSNGCS